MYQESLQSAVLHPNSLLFQAPAGLSKLILAGIGSLQNSEEPTRELLGLTAILLSLWKHFSSRLDSCSSWARVNLSPS